MIFYINKLICDSFSGLTCNFTHGWRAKWATFCSNYLRRKLAVSRREARKRPGRAKRQKFAWICRDLLNGTVDTWNRSIHRHVRTAIQILFKSSICFACTATKSERMNGYGLSFIFLCVLLYPLPICRPIAFTNQEGSCFSAHYKDLSAGMAMNARRLEHHSLEMLLP